MKVFFYRFRFHRLFFCNETRGFDTMKKNSAFLSLIRVAVLLLAAVTVVFFGCSGGDGKKNSPEEGIDLTVLFSSDLLGKIRSCGCTIEEVGGLGRKATYIEKVRGITKNLIVVDAGDALSLDLSFSQSEAELTFDAFEMMKLDAFTPGEIDFIFGLPFVQEMVERVSFDFLAANLVEKGSGKRIFDPAYKVIEIEGGMKVAITGIMDESIRFPAYIDMAAFEVAPAGKTLRTIVADMKRDADLLILLSHLGLKRSKSLAAQVPGFDLMVVGHGKPVVKKLEKIGETVILATGGMGQYVGRIDVKLYGKSKYSIERLTIEQLVKEIEIHSDVRDLFRNYGVALTEKERTGGKK